LDSKLATEKAIP